MTVPASDALLAKIKAGLEDISQKRWTAEYGVIPELDRMAGSRVHVRWNIAEHIARCCPENMAAIIARLEAAEARDQWQPIETAPRDGTPVLLATANAIHTACFDKVENGWRLLVRRVTSVVPVPGSPTHWKPLPANPNAGKNP